MGETTPQSAETAQVTESIQTRCPNMRRHSTGGLLMPCSDCYSLRVRSERLPEWQPEVRWHDVSTRPGETTPGGAPC